MSKFLNLGIQIANDFDDKKRKGIMNKNLINDLNRNFRKLKIFLNKCYFEYILCWIMTFVLLLLPNCAKTPEQKQLIKTGKAKLKIKLEGVVKPYRASKILAPVTGRVKEVYFNNGDWVKKGQVIYKINLDEVNLEIKNLKRQLNYLNKVIRQNKYLYYSTYKNKKRLIEVARTQLNRIASLYAEGFATKRELETAEEKYFRLLDETDMIKDTYTSKNADLLKQKDDLLAQLTKLEFVRDNAVVKAPITGFLTGSILIPEQEVVKGSVVGKILDLTKVVVKAGIAPGLYKFIHKGDKVKLDFITTPPYNTTAEITKVIPIVDPKIGRMVVEILLDNPNYLLQDGTKALVTIIPGKKVQKELYKDFYKKGSSVIEIKTGIK